jgi:ribosome biogenesis GTPase A
VTWKRLPKKVIALLLFLKKHGSPLVLESRRLGVLRKVGGKFLPNLNMTQRPIAEKYCEGKLKRISKEKLKVHETISREPISGFN